jgi:TRAP-type C4-dicarboxylate transport system substrate-binding protein
MISYNTSMLFWNKLSEKEKDVFRRATRTASIKSRQEVNRRLGKVIEELKGRGVEIVETDTSGFSAAIEANIDDILKGNQDAIAVYKKIKSGDF